MDVKRVRYQYKVGDTIHHWTIIEDLGLVAYGKRGRRQYKYLCRCTCGRESSLWAHALRSGRSKMCHPCSQKGRGATHGYYTGIDTKSKEGSALASAIYRCYNPNCKEYPYYGGRGIKICERWLGSEGYQNFVKDMGSCPPNYSIERIDVNGDYCPKNCCWATMKEQCRNRRSNAIYEGKCIAEWADVLNIPYDFVKYRLKTGRSVEEVKSLWESKQQETI